MQCLVPITATAQSQKTHDTQSYKILCCLCKVPDERLWAKLQGSVRTSLNILRGMYFAYKLYTLVQVYFSSLALLYSTTKLHHLLRKMRLLNANIYFKARILNVQWPSHFFQMSWLQTETVTHTNEYVYTDVLKTSIFLWTQSLPHPSAAPSLPPAEPGNQSISICLTPSKTLVRWLLPSRESKLLQDGMRAWIVTTCKATSFSSKAACGTRAHWGSSWTPALHTQQLKWPTVL